MLVVHGITNRDKSEFFERANEFAEAVGTDWEALPLYWGDLGGNGTNLRDALPGYKASSSVMNDASYALLSETRQRLLAKTQPAGFLVANYAETIDGILAGYNSGAAAFAQPDAANDAVKQWLTEQLPNTTHLKHIADQAQLKAVGELLRAAGPWLENDTANTGSSAHNFTGDYSFKKKFRQVLDAIDSLLGKSIEALGGHFNTLLRGSIAEGVALTFGDVVAYHQQRSEIMRRLFDFVKEKGVGTEHAPVTVVGHSLGGLITFDAALGIETPDGSKLYIDHWVTLGSQPAFFHIMTPRGDLVKYDGINQVKLPPTIKKWTNFWHALDVLAFVASPVFKLHNNNTPTDIELSVGLSEIVREKFWLHSVYWKHRDVIGAF
jgi:hypothetical protein